MESIRNVLDRIVDGSGVKFAAMLSSNGFVVESSRGADGDDAMVSAATCELVGLAGRIGKVLEGGECHGVLLQYEQLSVLIESVEPEVFLAAVLTDGSEVDNILARIKHSIPQLRQSFYEN